MMTVELEADPPEQTPPPPLTQSSPPVPPEDEDTAERTPCPLCSRKFLSDRLDKHITICQKIKEKKRKTFDAAKMRAENLDKINLVPTELIVKSTPPESKTAPRKGAAASKNKKPTPESQQKAAKESVNSKKTNWRAQHEEFIRNIRAARGEEVEGGDEENGENSGSRSKSLPPGMVECPSCGRRFSERASDRHIAWCTEKAATDERKRRNSNNQKDQQEALERMKARTKYKPPSLANGNSNSNNSSLSSSRTSLSKSKSTQNLNRSIGTGSSRKSTADSTISNNSRLSASSTVSTKTITTNSRTKNISKSTENINKSSRAQKGANQRTTNASRASTRTPVSDNTHSNQKLIQRNTIVVRQNLGAGMGPGAPRNVKSKINTGLSSPTKSTMSKLPSAPVMKFKEKFPNHQPTNASQNVDFQVLRRNSAYDDSPKTVPGVRTGGISPVKSTGSRNGGLANVTGASMSRSEVNLHKIGGDIKERIDMYISGLYDNEVMSNYADNFQSFISEHFKRRGANGDGDGEDGEEVTEEELMEAFKQQREAMTGSVALENGGQQLQKRSGRSGSINSDLDARGSTSDSADSGLGVFGTAHEKAMASQYPVAEILSPPMSELERRSRLTLRNGSLNDIDHLMRQQDITVMTALNGAVVGGANIGGSKSAHEQENGISNNVNGSYYDNEVDLPPPELTPRFCHSCGTKYPNTLAKFCYECGSRRFSTTIEH